MTNDPTEVSDDAIDMYANLNEAYQTLTVLQERQAELRSDPDAGVAERLDLTNHCLLAIARLLADAELSKLRLVDPNNHVAGDRKTEGPSKSLK